MATLLEQEQKRLKRAQDAEERERQSKLNRHKKALQARKTKDAIRLERRNLLGEAFMQAFEAGKLTPKHMAMINEILLMLPEADRGRNWDVVVPFLLPEKGQPKAVPANFEEPDELTQAAAE